MECLFYCFGNICENDIVSNLIQLGFNVTNIEFEIKNKSTTDAMRIDSISNHLSSHKYLFVFSVNYFPAISKVCRIYNIPYISWCVDAPIPELFDNSVTNPTNYIFCFDRLQYEEISRYNINHIFHLPLCTNVARWDQVISKITHDDEKKYSCDISFVGSLYSEYDRISNIENILPPYLQGYIQGMYNCQKQIQGADICESIIPDALIDFLKNSFSDLFSLSAVSVKNIDSFISSQKIISTHNSALERQEYLSELAAHFPVSLYTRSNTNGLYNTHNITIKGGCSTHTEMPIIFKLSRININLTSYSIRSGIPLRNFDIMGCGGFLLTNYQEEMFDYFEPGIDFDYFSSASELIDKCKFYLKNDNIRQAIAASGYNKVKNSHTYSKRLPLIITTALQ